LRFTLALPPGANLEEETQALAARAGAEAVFSLPAIKVFKIGVYFRFSQGGQASAHAEPPGDNGNTPEGIELSRAEKAAGQELEADLPLTPHPFEPMAGRLGISQEELLGLARGFLERGIMRRYAALLGHRRLGFLANAMVCWRVPPQKIEEVGRLMASSPAVTHCYERPTNALWPYNLFTMVHAPTREECHVLARELSQGSGIEDYILLFSTREYKKQRVRYFG
ncbi:MAG: Lrp/AsnC family transcriptional regulator, partial [Dehalococcoidia bacterium]